MRVSSLLYYCIPDEPRIGNTPACPRPGSRSRGTSRRRHRRRRSCRGRLAVSRRPCRPRLPLKRHMRQGVAKVGPHLHRLGVAVAPRREEPVRPVDGGEELRTGQTADLRGCHALKRREGGEPVRRNLHPMLGGRVHEDLGHGAASALGLLLGHGPLRGRPPASSPAPSWVLGGCERPWWTGHKRGVTRVDQVARGPVNHLAEQARRNDAVDAAHVETGREQHVVGGAHHHKTCGRCCGRVEVDQHLGAAAHAADHAALARKALREVDLVPPHPAQALCLDGVPGIHVRAV
mmetsp:Transcript_11693/g.29713  ORF Transcript_11693/g.29713 Transcript_11693/m.29713 type:complete len:291 (-) Transcript_11693:384-1256(-)